jgi:Methyltransferase domain
VHDVHLVVADTRTAPPPHDQVDLLFIDADHRYEGARADFDRWGRIVCPGGHLLFHDGVDVGGYGTAYMGVRRLMDEIDAAGGPFRRVEGAGSIAHFVRQRDAASA